MSENESRNMDKFQTDNDENDINHNHDERIFANRSKWIVRMCQNKPKSYQEMMERHEHLLREMSMAYFKKERNEEEQHHRRQEEIISKMPWMSLGQILRFEVRFAFHGYFMLVLYCITHLMMYQVIESCIMEQTRGFTGNQENKFYFLLLVISLFILRITGGLWDWLSPNRCTAVQSEINWQQHQVANRNNWNKNVQSWFQKRRHVRILFQYVAFYVILVAIVYFKHQFFTLIIHDRSWIYENLPSRQYNMETPISQALVANVANRGKCEQSKEQCSLLTQMAQQDDEYLYNRVTLTSYFNFRGYSGMYLVSPFGMRLLLLTISVTGIIILETLGFQWKR